MQNVKISIIIPIYNVEKYLERCVRSAIDQSYINIEIILVDDGSPDKCPQMCDEFAKQDDRITVIHKVNGGLSDARNVGIQSATGEYILFLDSDDALDNRACEMFFQAIVSYNYPQIIVGQTCRICDGERSIINPYMHFDGGDGESFFYQYWSKNKYFCALAPNNLYSKKYILDNKFFFEKGLLHEDERWTPLVFLNANSVVSIENVFYNYYIRENSITTKKNKTKNALDLMNTVDFLMIEYEKIKHKKLKAIMKEYNVSLYLGALATGNFFKAKERINRYMVWKNVYSLKGRLKALIFCISPRMFGFLRQKLRKAR